MAAKATLTVDDILGLLDCDREDNELDEFCLEGSDDEVSDLDDDPSQDESTSNIATYQRTESQETAIPNADSEDSINNTSAPTATSSRSRSSSSQSDLPWFDTEEATAPGQGYKRQYQNINADNIQWNPPCNPPVKVIPFKEYSKPYGPSFTSPTSLLQLFHTFFTTELLGIICTETNRYASICLKERYDTWDKVTIEEIQAYLGFMILMGLVQMPSIRDYWRCCDTFHYAPIASRISRARFLQIHRFLHFVDNSNLPTYGQSTYSKIQKVKPILIYLSKKSRKYYKYLFFAAVDITITNLFVTSKFFPSIDKKSCKDFRIELANQLIGDYNSRKKRGRPSIQPPPKRFCASHYPMRSEKKGNRCFFCHNYMQRRRETIWYCKDCDKHLCHRGQSDDCFYIYHTQYGPIAP